MRRGWIVLAGWGLLLLAIALVQIVFQPTAIELALLAGSALAVVVLGLLAYAGERRRARPRPGDRETPELLPWASTATVVLALGVGLAVFGLELGWWMVGIGAGIAAAGLGGLVREHRAARS